MSTEREIDLDELDWGEGDELTLDDIPYSGIAIRKYPDGTIKRRLILCDGIQEGICRDFYINGQLEREWNVVNGHTEGKFMEWYDNGAPRLVGIYEYGVELEYTEWERDGTVRIHRQIDKNSLGMEYVLKMRREGNDNSDNI